MVSDAGAVGSAVREALAANPRSVAEYRGGNGKALGFLMGQAMRALGGKADPGSVSKALKDALG
ncbi:MAG: Asp-tRNA(Asn)/Glu-tRNA(Gln) amidotransferase GatCAB subunit B, partial [Oscillospiraceae bacterium]|nr:Asp-tRNA(Asn)/Glu-tRNA(Gln) amidotransferase GatCAB subunit B [Oscillospiraceae bacterium]